MAARRPARPHRCGDHRRQQAGELAEGEGGIGKRGRLHPPEPRHDLVERRVREATQRRRVDQRPCEVERDGRRRIVEALPQDRRRPRRGEQQRGRSAPKAVDQMQPLGPHRLGWSCDQRLRPGKNDRHAAPRLANGAVNGPRARRIELRRRFGGGGGRARPPGNIGVRHDAMI
ncbi:MAG: hypothetical protein B7Z64_05130 [Acidiphilium sp. 21-68-69]|nr:MAG: hypothetical protein B7Z64_05130 [Acidiphilium sp. 21-68-69]